MLICVYIFFFRLKFKFQASLVNNEKELAEVIEKILPDSGAMATKFLGGREFTIAISDQIVHTPLERIFESNEKFSPPNGTKKEKAVSPSDPIFGKLKELALDAYNSVSGNSFARVDIRMDSSNQNLFVLEVNPLCSIGPNSYFALSLEQNGYSRVSVFSSQIRTALSKNPLLLLPQSSHQI